MNRQRNIGTTYGGGLSFSRPSHQSGFTLIEMMVASFLGLLLIAGIIQIYLGSAQSFRLQAGLAEVQDKGRTSMDFIAREIENAGFGDDALVAGAFATLGTNVVFTAGTGNNLGSGSDAIRITYNGTTDCTGAAAPASVVVNTFDVVGSELRCNGQPLIDNVDSFQLLYGVDSNTDGFIDEYLTSTRVIATGNQSRVMAIRIGLLVASSRRVFDANVAQSQKVLNEANLTYNDAILRRLFTTTVLLANRP